MVNDRVPAQLDSARAGCRDAQAELLKQYENYLFSIARREVDASLQNRVGVSDIVQQTFAKAVDGFEKFSGDDEAQLKGWLRKILLNQIHQTHRDVHRKKRDIAREHAFPADSGHPRLESAIKDVLPTPCTHAIVDEQEAMLHQCLLELPHDYQQVIHLRNWKRLPFKAIGKQMQRSEDAAQKLWYRAIMQLQEMLESGDH